MGKHSSLFQLYQSVEEKKVYKIDTLVAHNDKKLIVTKNVDSTRKRSGKRERGKERERERERERQKVFWSNSLVRLRTNSSQTWADVKDFNGRSGCMHEEQNLRSVAKRPNLKLRTRHKQVPDLYRKR